MKRRILKKDDEKYILHDFARIAKVYIFDIEPVDPPDFTLHWVTKGPTEVEKKVGVEITKIINPDLKEIESNQDSIVQIAWDMFKKEFNDPLNVFVEFRRVSFSYKIENLRKVARIIFDKVREIVSRNLDSKYQVSQEFRHNEVLERITVNNDNDIEYWQVFGAFSVPYIDEDHFADIVRKKEEKIANYTSEFDEKWLLLASNFGHESSHFQFSRLKAEFPNSPFDRIFVLQSREDKVFPIKGAFDED